jgi:hypothetical protein
MAPVVTWNALPSDESRRPLGHGLVGGPKPPRLEEAILDGSPLFLGLRAGPCRSEEQDAKGQQHGGAHRYSSCPALRRATL